MLTLSNPILGLDGHFGKTQLLLKALVGVILALSSPILGLDGTTAVQWGANPRCVSDMGGESW